MKTPPKKEGGQSFWAISISQLAPVWSSTPLTVTGSLSETLKKSQKKSIWARLVLINQIGYFLVVNQESLTKISFFLVLFLFNQINVLSRTVMRHGMCNFDRLSTTVIYIQLSLTNNQKALNRLLPLGTHIKHISFSVLGSSDWLTRSS